MVKKQCNKECTCNIMNIYIDPNDKESLNVGEYLKIYDEQIKHYPQVDTVKIVFNFPREKEAVQCSGNFIDRIEYIKYLTEMFDIFNKYKDLGRITPEQFRLKKFWNKQ